VAGHAVSEVLSLEVDGDNWVVEQTWVDDGMRALGIQSLFFVIEGEMEGDKIKSYTATMSDESFAEFADAMTQAANKGAVRTYIEELANEGNESAAEGIFAEDVVSHSPISPEPITGIEALKASVAETRAGMHDVQATIEDMFSAGDTVVVRGSTKGTHTGSLPDMPATNKGAEWTFIEVYHVKDGKIQEIFEQFDALGFLQQIGIMPADRESYGWSETLAVSDAEPEDAETIKSTVLGAGQASMAADTLGQLDEMYADDFVNHDPSRPQVTDLESFKAWSADNVAGFPDQELVSDELLVAGDKVMERWTWTGTESETGTPLSMTGTTIYRFEEGKIAEAWWANNMMGVMMQMQAAMADMEQPSEEVEAEATEVISGYADNDGVSIYYEVEGKGPPLVLVHWWTGNTEDWRIYGYVDALKDEYRLILVDMRGHGKSDKPHESEAFKAEIQASDVIAVLDQLGIEKAHYYGWSLGGTLGWALAKYAPERFHSFIIGGDGPAAKDVSEMIAALRDLGPDMWARMLEDGARDNDVWNATIYDAHVDNDVESLALNSEELSSTDFNADIPDMQMPFLLIGIPSDDDYANVVEATDRLPNANLASFPNLDHGQGFMFSDQVLPHVTEFLEEVSAETDALVAELDSATVAEIEALVKEMMSENQIPGFALGIVKDGDVVYVEGFGEAELGGDREVTPQTLFHLASVNKTTVATALLQLVEQGKIDLDAPVTDFLPYFQMDDEHYKNITIRQLLSHTSGMPNPDGAAFMAAFKVPEDDDEALERYVQGLSTKSLLFVPGEAWEYSCVGFDVLGDVIAKVSGQSYEDYVQENIFTPLGMTHTTSLLEDSDPELLTSPHVFEAGEVVISSVFPYSRIHGPCNNLYSNSEDMARYAMAHLNRGELDGARILPESVYDVMWSPYVATTWAEWLGSLYDNYGLGWFVGEAAGGPVIHHPGGDPGFHSHLVLLPEEGIAIVAMANLLDPEEPSFYTSDIANLVMESLLGVKEEVK